MRQNCIQIQTESFDQQMIYQWLSEPHAVGAVNLFIGKVRDHNLGENVSGLFLEYYPVMTEKVLAEIVEQARLRWNLYRVAVIHRVGQLYTGDEIVLVGVSASHRSEAYQANEFIMDYLKTQAPFWKKEQTSLGEKWIEARDSDQNACEKWNE